MCAFVPLQRTHARATHAHTRARAHACTLAPTQVSVADYYGFEGWLVNIENPVAPAAVPLLVTFVRGLRAAMRAGRAGASGRAIAFCNEEEVADLWAIERLIKQEIPQVLEHPWHHYPAFEKMIVCRNEGLKKAQKQSHKGKKPSYRRRRRRGPWIPGSTSAVPACCARTAG